MKQKEIQLKEIYEFLKERNKITELCERSGASTKTVVGTFAMPNFNSLKGKQINICHVAITIVEEINKLSTRAAEALNK